MWYSLPKCYMKNYKISFMNQTKQVSNEQQQQQQIYCIYDGNFINTCMYVWEYVCDNDECGGAGLQAAELLLFVSKGNNKTKLKIKQQRSNNNNAVATKTAKRTEKSLEMMTAVATLQPLVARMRMPVDWLVNEWMSALARSDDVPVGDSVGWCLPQNAKTRDYLCWIKWCAGWWMRAVEKLAKQQRQRELC